jgi:hypothetical protein
MMVAGHEVEHITVVAMMIEKGAKCNAVDNFGKIPSLLFLKIF